MNNAEELEKDYEMSGIWENWLNGNRLDVRKHMKTKDAKFVISLIYHIEEVYIPKQFAYIIKEVRSMLND